MSRYPTRLWLCLTLAVAAYHQPIFAETNSSEYSLITKEQMLALPRPERTVAAALRMCMERSSAREFCGWFFVEPSTELVLGGTCFDEFRNPCIQVSYSYTNTTQRNTHRLACDTCTACSDHKSKCDNINCTMLCYCSCAYPKFGFNSDRGLEFDRSKSDWHFVFPCSGLCNGETQCPYDEDEHRYMCQHSSQSVAKETSWSETFASPGFYLGLLGCLLLFGYMVFYILNMWFKWFP